MKFRSALPYYIVQVVRASGQVAVKQAAVALSEQTDAFHAKCPLKFRRQS